MSKILTEVIAANEEHAKAFPHRTRSTVPHDRKFAILTCMDARLFPSKFAGLNEGEAYVVRNAGGRASDDAIRSLIISNILAGTREWFVIHHTNCGMNLSTNKVMQELVSSNTKLPSSTLKKTNHASWGSTRSAQQRVIDWLAFTDEVTSVVDDVRRIRDHHLVPRDIVIYGFVYDVESGRLIEVPEAMEAGQPHPASVR